MKIKMQDGAVVKFTKHEGTYATQANVDLAFKHGIPVDQAWVQLTELTALESAKEQCDEVETAKRTFTHPGGPSNYAVASARAEGVRHALSKIEPADETEKFRELRDEGKTLDEAATLSWEWAHGKDAKAVRKVLAGASGARPADFDKGAPTVKPSAGTLPSSGKPYQPKPGTPQSDDDLDEMVDGLLGQLTAAQCGALLDKLKAALQRKTSYAQAVS